MSRKPSPTARCSTARQAPERSVARGEAAARDRAGRPEAVAADGELGVELAHRLRIARLDLDEPAERIRAVARALRAAQHLHLLDVESRGDHADAAEVDLVHQESDGRIRRALVLLELADAAQLEVARARARPGPGQRRNLRQQFLEMDDGGLAHVLGGEHGDAARTLGDRHGPQRGRHENGLELRPAARVADAAAPARRHAMNGSGFSDTPAPYAGPNRIRFNGFAGDRNRHLRSFQTTPRQRAS